MKDISATNERPTDRRNEWGVIIFDKLHCHYRPAIFVTGNGNGVNVAKLYVGSVKHNNSQKVKMGKWLGLSW